MPKRALPPELLADLDAAFEVGRSWPAGGTDGPPLANHLYRHWFQADAPPRIWPTPAHYAAAVAPAMRAEVGWLFERIDAEGLWLCHGDGRRLRVPWLAAAPAHPLQPLKPGSAMRRLAPTAEPVNGFWHLWSDAWQAGPPDSLVRLYLPLAAGAELAAARLIVAHSPLAATWAAKLLAGEHSAGRRDPALVYLPPGGEREGWVEQLLEHLAPLLVGSRVRLAAPFAGAWLAADPGSGRSFGQAVTETLAALPAASWQRRSVFRAAAMAALRPLLPHLENRVV